MTGAADAAYPYPGDDLAGIGSASTVLGICSNELTYLNQSLTETKTGLAGAWQAEAATKCQADIATLTTVLPGGGASWPTPPRRWMSTAARWWRCAARSTGCGPSGRR